MGQTKPTLTISLLCSGRKQTTRKCLDSLRRIMDVIPSELIIVDTGCDDDTHDILLEYADRVIPFVWCRDFSKARNVGLKAAKGEWFLYIDDDEWFEDITELVDFFKSGDYKNYAMANYIQRNYADYGEKYYSDAWVSRMAKITGELQFQSSIHEYLAPIYGECRLLHSYVKHFGYVFDSPEEKYRHSQRNISLLREMIRKERSNSRWWMQLAQEYNAINENAKLYDICTEALQYFSNWNNRGVNKDRGAFYVGKLLSAFNLFRYEDAVADYEKAICDKRNTDICRASLFLNGTYAFFMTQQYDRCRECGEKYLELYETWHADEKKIIDEAAFFVRDAFDRENLEKTYSYLILSGLRQKQDRELHRYFPCISLQPELDRIYFYPPLVPELIAYWSETEYDRRFSDYADILMRCKLLADAVVRELRKIEKDSAREERYDRLVRIFSQTGAEHFYIIYMKIIHAGKKGDRATLKAHFRFLFAHVVDILQLPEYIWEIAMESPEMIHGLFLEIPFEQWKNGIDAYIEHADAQSVEHRMTMLSRPQFQADIRYDYFQVRAKEALLVYGRYQDDAARQKELLEDFSRSAVTFYSLFFAKRAFQGEMEFLPGNCRAAIHIREALDCEETNVTRAIACYERAWKAFPSFDSTLQRYCETLRVSAADAENSAACGEELKTEMTELSRGVKDRIRILTKQGFIKEAEEAVWQLKALMPEDQEIPELETRLRQAKRAYKKEQDRTYK